VLPVVVPQEEQYFAPVQLASIQVWPVAATCAPTELSPHAEQM
jgi:hypothetical protein